jgi:hypothetical protein
MDPTLIVVAVGGALAVAAVAFLMLRRKGPKEDKQFHYNCPHCKRRLRYRASQVGRRATCPLCRKEITFPPPGRAPVR